MSSMGMLYRRLVNILNLGEISQLHSNIEFVGLLLEQKEQDYRYIEIRSRLVKLQIPSSDAVRSSKSNFTLSSSRLRLFI